MFVKAQNYGNRGNVACKYMKIAWACPKAVLFVTSPRPAIAGLRAFYCNHSRKKTYLALHSLVSIIFTECLSRVELWLNRQEVGTLYS